MTMSLDEIGNRRHHGGHRALPLTSPRTGRGPVHQSPHEKVPAHQHCFSAAIRVVVVDDDGIVRAGVRSFLESDATISVVGEASSGETAIDIVHELKPDVVVMDLKMPQIDGISATAVIRRDLPSTQVVALTSATDAYSILGMIRAGAIGYLMKQTKRSDLCQAIHLVARGQAQLGPEAAAVVAQEMGGSPTTEPLTERELDVLRLLVKGVPNKAIARALGIGDATAKSHVSNIIAKLGVTSRTQVALKAVTLRLVNPGAATIVS